MVALHYSDCSPTQVPADWALRSMKSVSPLKSLYRHLPAKWYLPVCIPPSYQAQAILSSLQDSLTFFIRAQLLPPHTYPSSNTTPPNHDKHCFNMSSEDQELLAKIGQLAGKN